MQTSLLQRRSVRGLRTAPTLPARPDAAVMRCVAQLPSEGIQLNSLAKASIVPSPATSNGEDAGRPQLHMCHAADPNASSVPVSTVTSGGGNGPTSGDNGGGGGGGDNNGGSGAGGAGPLDPKLAALLAAAGRSLESFPPDFAKAMLAGKVTPDVLKRWLELESNFFVKLVWGIEGFRDRLLGDPSFPVKVAIECGIGVVTKVTAEKTKRGDHFWGEIDFVAANVVMAIIADFMLTWLPAPTLSFAPRASAGSNALMRFFASCPDNAFQRVPPGMEPFTLTQRVGAILRNGGKLLGVGFGASLLGVGITNALILLRQAVDPGWAPPNKPQDVVSTSLAYGVYMAVSSNLRYQVIAGVLEERGIEVLFKGNPMLCHALSFVVRTGNTFLGSLLWVDFVRLLGMQTSKAPLPPKIEL